MEETKKIPNDRPNPFLKIEIKQKNTNIRKRKVKAWTSYQDAQLIKLYKEYPKKWATIAQLMGDRNQNQCMHRYRRLSQMGSGKKIWSQEQDKTVINLIKKVGKNWKIISQMLGTKTGKQIRERFINKLDPKIKTDDWTEQQDKIIAKYFSQLGSKWSQISKKIPGRPENKIKNRFYSFIQKYYQINYIQLQNQCQQSTQKQHLKDQSQQIKYNLQAQPQENAEDPNKKQPISIKQIQQQLQLGGQKDEIYYDEGNKYILQSLIKVDEEILNNQEQRQRSIKNIVSHGQLDNENDFFYLSH